MPVVAGVPVDLLAAVVLFVLGGGWLAIEVLRALPDVLDLMTADTGGAGGVLGDFGQSIRALGWMTLAAVLMAATVAVSLLAIAWLLWRRTRVGRGLAWVAAAWLLLTAVLGEHFSGEIGFATLTACLGAAIIAFAPAARAALDAAPHPQQGAAAVAVARITLLGCTVLFGLGAVMNFAAATFESKYALVALLECGVAIGAFLYSGRMPRGESQLRLAATLGAVVGIALGVATSGAIEWVAPLVAIAIVAIATLWLPPDVRALFGEQPIEWQALTGRPAPARTAPVTVPDTPPNPPPGPPPAPPGPPPAPPRAGPPVPPPPPGFPPPPTPAVPPPPAPPRSAPPADD